MDYFANTKLQDNTKKNYNKFLQKWIDLFDFEVTPSYIYNRPLESISVLRKWLQENDSDTQSILNRYVTIIMSYRKYNLKNVSSDPIIYSKWNDIHKLTYQQIISHRLQSQPTFLQSEKTGSEMTWNEIIDIRDQLPIGAMKLLIAFYTYIPPMRADYGCVSIIKYGDNPPTANYLMTDEKECTLTMRDFKTSKSYGEIKQKLPNELFLLLQESLKLQPRDWLFCNRYGSPFNRSNFSSWANEGLSRVFSKDFSLTFFRHIFLSQLPKMTLSERQRVANLMGHSLDQQVAYQWINSDD